MVRGPLEVLEICPCGPSKKCRRKNENLVNCVSRYSWKSEFGNNTWQSLFTFSPSTDVSWNLPYYSTHLPTFYSALSIKQRFKELWTWCFSPSFPLKSGTTPVTQPGTIRIHNRGPKYRTCSCIYATFLIVLPTLSLHIEMVTYCTSYTNNRTCQIVYKYTGIKICYKFINLFSKGTGIRRCAELFWLKKVDPTSKTFEKRWSKEILYNIRNRVLTPILHPHKF